MDPRSGIGHGGLFTLALTVPVVVSRSASEAGGIRAMAFFVGYGCTALTPLPVGFHLALLLAAAGVAITVSITRLRRGDRCR